VRRFGMAIGLRDACAAEYRRVHDGPGVRDLLREANIRNFNRDLPSASLQLL
jgi:L-rhamnose mutarotase